MPVKGLTSGRDDASFDVAAAVLELHPTPTAIVSPAGVFVYVNKAFSDYLRIPQGQLVGTPFVSYLAHKGELPTNGVLLPEGTHNLDYLLGDGSLRQACTHVALLPETNGMAMVAIVQAAEWQPQPGSGHSEVPESEILWSDLFSHSPAAIVIYETTTQGEEFRVRDLNPACARMENVDGESVLGLPLHQAFARQATAHLIEALERVWRTGTPEQIEVAVRDNHTLLGWWKHTLVRASDRYVVDIYEDVTGEKKAQQELRQLAEELENRVIERTLQLQAANRELEAFTYSVSHDLRAPLRHLSGYSQLLLERHAEELSETARHYLEAIADSATRMGRLINGLLQLSRATRGEIRFVEVDMNRLVSDTLEILREKMEAREIRWHVAQLPAATGDPVLIGQVWANLLDNALKYTRSRAVAEIEIGAEESDSETTYFVRDNGLGFDMRYLDQLFMPFHRLHPDENFEGTGIGLATVSRIVARHGGRVWAEGKPNEGATFYFSLPKQKQEPKKDA
ncbi:MAG: ATP-binding protein [Thermoleophilia bacterium]|nr:ATP-binding protein [Thermoleophilia bacterium]